MIFHGIPLECINQAAVTYHIPALLIVAIMKMEGGKVGDAIKNRNGTYDLGVMQVNSSWLPQLKGITRKQLQFNSCTNVQVASWILAKSVASKPGWKGVGNYHSHTPHLNQRYSQKVRTIYWQLKTQIRS